MSETVCREQGQRLDMQSSTTTKNTGRSGTGLATAKGLKRENDALKMVSCLYRVKSFLLCQFVLHFLKVPEQFNYKYPLQHFTTGLFSSLNKPLKYTLHFHMETRCLKTGFFLLQRWWTARNYATVRLGSARLVKLVRVPVRLHVGWLHPSPVLPVTGRRHREMQASHTWAQSWSCPRRGITTVSECGAWANSPGCLRTAQTTACS